MSDKVCGAVLAAGAGRRFGGPKILARQGEWLQRAVFALRDGGCDEIVVAMGARLVDPPDGASRLIVDDWSIGLSATVRAVLDHAEGRRQVAGVVLHVVDTPDVDGRVVRRVVDATARHREGVARATFDGAPGHPVYIGAAHFASLRADLFGDAGAGAYLRTHPRTVAVECGDLASGVDHDSPE